MRRQGDPRVIFTTIIMLQTLVQQCIDDAKRGRVMSLFNMSWGGLVAVGGPLMGTLAGALGPTSTIALGGVVCGCFGLYRLARGG